MKLLTTDEAARMLRVKPGTLAKWRSSKRHNLPYMKVGGVVVYDERDIEEFVKSRRIE